VPDATSLTNLSNMVNNVSLYSFSFTQSIPTASWYANVTLTQQPDLPYTLTVNYYYPS
jgi:hypothetical protein